MLSERSQILLTDIIHVIWFGEDFAKQPTTVKLNMHGETIEPGAYLKKLKEWAKANKNHMIYLWTDNQSVESVEKTVTDEKITNIICLNFHDVFAKSLAHRNILAKIDRLSSASCAGIALPNYGAASDLAKALVLLSYGGIYLDIDTDIKTTDGSNNLLPLPLALTVSSVTDILLGSQGKISPNQLSNDIIVAKVSCFSLDLYLKIINKYMTEKYIQRMTYSDAKGLWNENANTLIDNCNRTTEAFGPGLIRFCVLHKLLPNYELNTSNPDYSIIFFENMALECFKMSHLQIEPSEAVIPFLRAYFPSKLDTIERNKFSDYCFTNYTRRGQDNAWMIPLNKIELLQLQQIRQVAQQLDQTDQITEQINDLERRIQQDQREQPHTEQIQQMTQKISELQQGIYDGYECTC